MNILDRYTTKVQTYLHQVLDKENFLYRKALYHFGFVDEQGLIREHVGWGRGLRSTLLLLTVESLKGNIWEKAVSAAAAIELFHNATLVVDDWQDKDPMRRGSPAVWTMEDVGPEQGVNVGLFLTTLSSKVLVDLSEKEFVPEIRFKVQSLFEQTKISVIEGQQQDIAFEKQQEIALDEYLDMIAHKTGVLIQTSMLIGALLADADRQTIAQFAELGNVLGLLFQMQDDFLGVYGDVAKTGKPAEDILHKKKSLPVILAFEYALPQDREKLLKIYSKQQKTLSATDVNRIKKIFVKYDIQKKVRQRIEQTYQEVVDLFSETNLSKKADFLFLADLLAHREK